MNMRNAKWANDFTMLDPDGTSLVDTYYSKSYVRHLFAANEMLAFWIASLHNLAFYLWLVKEARLKIQEGTFASWKDDMVKKVTQRL